MIEIRSIVWNVFCIRFLEASALWAENPEPVMDRSSLVTKKTDGYTCMLKLPRTMSFRSQFGVMSAEKVRAPAMISGIVAGVLYAAIALVSYLASHFDYADLVRLVIGFSFVGYSILFYINTFRVEVVSVAVVALSSFVFLVSVPVFSLLFLSDGNAISHRMTVSMILGLFLHYGMLGLHPRIGLGLGALASLIAIFSLFILDSSGVLNSAMYLTAANFVGCYICKSSVVRDRSEAMTKIQLKQNWSRLGATRAGFDKALTDHKRWVSTIAHEVYQPLYSANLALNQVSAIIKEGNEGLCAFNDIEKLRANIRDVEIIIGSIAARSMLDLRSARLRYRWISLGDVLSWALEQIADLDPSSKDRISIDFSGGCLNGVVFTDPHYLVRVFRNIVENGLRHSEAGPFGVKICLVARSRMISIIFLNKVVDPRNEKDVDFKSLDLRLGMGLGLGGEFIKGAGSILPGFKIKSRLFAGNFWLCRVSIGLPFFFLGRDYKDDLLSTAALELHLFCEDWSFIFSFAGMACEDVTSLIVRPLSDFSDQLEFFSKNSFPNNFIFVIFVSHSMIPAEDFFGAQVHKKMQACGRYIFISDFSFDESYEELGICLDSTEFLRSELSRILVRLSPGSIDRD